MKISLWPAVVAVLTVRLAVAGNLIAAEGIRIEYDGVLHSRIIATDSGTEVEVGPLSASEVLSTSHGDIEDFAFETRRDASISDGMGEGRRSQLTGRSADGLVKTLNVTTYAAFPGIISLQVRYTNEGSQAVHITGWVNHRYVLAVPDGGQLWSYQSGSYEKRPDWVLPVGVGFRQDNFQGMNASDYGGGTPLVDLWRRDVGIAVGDLELVPKPISLPIVRATAQRATLAVQSVDDRELPPGQSMTTLRTFVSVHHGDHFRTLQTYRRTMVAMGMSLPSAPPSAFEPIWCAWGYGRDFTADQVAATVPVAKRLGFGWVTLDDGWQTSIGNWTPNAGKYPRGDADMKALVQSIHAAGMKAQLWWSPLSVDPSDASRRGHRDVLLREADGLPRKISWWNTDYECPAYGPVRAEARAFVRKALGEWGFDGLKIDGQHLNAAPQCFNAEHHHEVPQDSAEGVPAFFKAIWEASQDVKPEALVELCPCGTTYSYFTMPFFNMTAASDPESSWQVRLKGKSLKALAGDGVAYFGDHVEMSEGGDDFASTLGVGGVVGSNFVWPGAPGKKDPKLLLTPAREREWAFWIKTYQAKRLSEGQYLGELYDIGFDRPEAHVISKQGRLYYAFFATRFDGPVELRGLGKGRYRLRDYESDRELGFVQGPTAQLPVRFKRHLLLEAIPEA